MVTILEAASQSSKKIARRIAVASSIAVAFGLVALLSWDAYFRVEDNIKAAEGQIAHLLQVGDSFQLRGQLLSLVSAGVFDGFLLREPSGFEISGGSNGEETPIGLRSFEDKNFPVFFKGLGFHVVRSFEIPLANRFKAKLTVTRLLHIEVFSIAAAILVGFYFSIRYLLGKYLRKFATDLTMPISDLSTAISRTRTGSNGLTAFLGPDLAGTFKFSEIANTYESFKNLIWQLEAEQDLRLKAEKDAAFAQLASQVAHDIRSPLAALRVLLARLANKSDSSETEILMGVTQRINDIANSLLFQSRDLSADPTEKTAHESVHNSEPILLTSLIDMIVSEKRLQYMHLPQIKIRADLNRSYGIFVQGSEIELSRILSNLINNSVESISGDGFVAVSIWAENNHALVSVEDNGKGIPADLIPQLGKGRISFEKKGGSGLGIYHAQKILSEMNGSITIDSTQGKGTLVSLMIPRTTSPQWFVQEFGIKSGQTIVTVDDDQIIHQSWAQTLINRSEGLNVKHISHTSLKIFEAWARKFHSADVLYLIDYDFIGQDGNGLDSVLRLGIGRQAILVSSKCDDTEIRALAEKHGIRLLPKNLISLVRPVSLAGELPA